MLSRGHGSIVASPVFQKMTIGMEPGTKPILVRTIALDFTKAGQEQTSKQGAPSASKVAG